jgi:hypothetical protein
MCFYCRMYDIYHIKFITLPKKGGIDRKKTTIMIVMVNVVTISYIAMGKFTLNSY